MAQYFQTLEHFTELLYNQTSGLEVVDEARMELVCHGHKTMEKNPTGTNSPFTLGSWIEPNRIGLIQHAV